MSRDLAAIINEALVLSIGYVDSSKVGNGSGDNQASFPIVKEELYFDYACT